MPKPVEKRKQPAANIATNDNLRQPPYSVEAEQSVLGGVMMDNRAWDQIADRLTEQDFYRPDHKVIFTILKQMLDKDIPCDPVTISQNMDPQQLETVGGMSYLGALYSNTPTAANILAYANIVRERSVMRQLIEVGTEIAQLGFNSGGQTSSELLDFAERQVFNIAEQETRYSRSYARVDSILSRVIDQIEALHSSTDKFTGVPTRFTDFDKITSGLQKSDLIIVAGRPSMGKTSFALNIAERAALQGIPVGVFSMEMPAEQLVMRMLSSLGRIDQQRLRTGELDDDDFASISRILEMIHDKPLYIDDTPSLTPTELRARARRLKRESDLKLIVVDYLQLMQVGGTRENRTGEISEISRSLKSLARELNIPVIALSQLNRSLESRPNKRPLMSDLRESGAIEQDADLIVFIYRDEVYNPESDDKGIAEIIVGKHRNGPTGMVRLTFQGQYTSFENYIKEEGFM